MAFVERTLPAPVADVWAALIDPTTYPSWLVGAQRIRAVDDSWPEVDSAFHHQVGFWPFLVADRSIVLEILETRRLVLEVRATPLVRGVVTFELRPDDGGAATLLAMEEEPKYRVVGNLLRPVLDPLTHARNQRSLQHLESVVVSRR